MYFPSCFNQSGQYLHFPYSCLISTNEPNFTRFSHMATWLAEDPLAVPFHQTQSSCCINASRSSFCVIVAMWGATCLGTTSKRGVAYPCWTYAPKCLFTFCWASTPEFRWFSSRACLLPRLRVSVAIVSSLYLISQSEFERHSPHLPLHLKI